MLVLLYDTFIIAVAYIRLMGTWVDKFLRNKSIMPVISHTIQYFNININGNVMMKISRCSKGQCTMYFLMSDMVSA